MTHKIPPHHPLRRYFAGTLENAFYTRLGICAPELVGYLTDLLIDFVHIGHIYNLRSATGDVLVDLTDMLTKSYLGPDVPPQTRDRLVHRHVGDYTLYWIGLYPESLDSRRETLIDFTVQGKKSYALASQLTGPADQPPAAVLLDLSRHFEECAYGLNLVRRDWEDGGHPGDPARG